MPYIKKEDREEVNDAIAYLIKSMSKFDEREEDGVVNYVISNILRTLYPVKYFHINRAIGVLECIKQEYYRKVAAPYEEQKIIENGDI